MSYQSFDPPQPLDGCERCGMESRWRICESCAEQDEIERADGVDAWEVEMGAMYGESDRAAE